VLFLRNEALEKRRPCGKPVNAGDLSLNFCPAATGARILFGSLPNAGPSEGRVFQRRSRWQTCDAPSLTVVAMRSASSEFRDSRSNLLTAAHDALTRFFHTTLAQGSDHSERSDQKGDGVAGHTGMPRIIAQAGRAVRWLVPSLPMTRDHRSTQGVCHPRCDPPTASAPAVRVTAILAKAERERLDRSTRRAEKRGHWATDADARRLASPNSRRSRDRRHQPKRKMLDLLASSAILQSEGMLFGQCRHKSFSIPVRLLCAPSIESRKFRVTHQSLAPIDIVITWVNGGDPAHQARRISAQQRLGRPLHPNAINPHRWGASDELSYCLRSLSNHAPWLRHVWIVTDNQTPDLSAMPEPLRQRISIIDHRVIFAGFEAHLPTFNSVAIETLLWRIPGLSEQFVYFNDDVFLTSCLSPDDVFRGGLPVLRGKWADYSALADDAVQMADPALFNHHVQINAARLAGYDAGHLWASAHVVHPLRRSIMEAMFDSHRDAMLANLAHPFRDLSQFQPIALHNHLSIRSGAYVAQTRRDHLHLRSGAVIDFPPEDVRAYLRRATTPGSKFLCVNDLPQVEAVLSDTRDWIERAIGA